MSGVPCFMPEPASPNSCPVNEAHTTCSAAACRYTNDPEYMSAIEILAGKEEILARKEKILLELLKQKRRLEENLLLSQGELLGPCCGTLVGCRSRGGPEGCTSSANSLSGQAHCWAARWHVRCWAIQLVSGC